VLSICVRPAPPTLDGYEKRLTAAAGVAWRGVACGRVEQVKQVRTERQKEGSMERRPSSNMEASPSGKAVQSGSSSSTPIEHDKPPSAIVKSGEMQFYKTPDLDFTPVKSAVAPSRVR
jgi:hypothetical protein